MNKRKLSLHALLMSAILLCLVLGSAFAQGEDPVKPPPVVEMSEDGTEMVVGHTASPAPTQYESEPNNDFGDANDLWGFNNVMYGEINGPDDIDFYRIWLDAGHDYFWDHFLVDIDAQANGSELDPVVCLYNSSRTLLTCNDDSDGYDSLIYYELELDSSYYISVRDFSYPFEGGPSYYYTLSFYNPILISADRNGKVDGLLFKKTDILAWYDFGDVEKWSMFFDASDMGIRGDLEGIGSFVDTTGEIALTLGRVQRLWVDGASTKVRPQDILGFSPGAFGSFGPNTSGELRLLHAGADSGLTRNAEKIDALAYNYRIVSTTGSTRTSDGSQYQDEDLFHLDWGMAFDGSDIPGLRREDIIAASFWHGSGYQQLTIKGKGTINGQKLDQKQIFWVTVYDYPEAWDCCHVFWDGRDHGFNYNIDAHN